MPNGKPGDHPYTDIVAHGMDLGEPEIAATVRRIEAIADLDPQYLLSLIVESGMPFAEGTMEDHDRADVLDNLARLERLIVAARQESDASEE